MNDVLMDIINNYGYLGIMFLLFIETLLPPIPSEIVLLFGGFLTVHTEMKLSLMIVSATVGSLLGASVLYLLGRLITKSKLKQLISGKVGRRLGLKARHVDVAGDWFVKYQARAVLICRCIPIVRSLISIPAGAAKMNFFLFLILTCIGSAVWNSLIIFLGSLWGDAWQSLMPYLKGFTDVMVVLLCIAVIAIFYRLIKREL